jgi:GT2 family glycosyltransferase
VRGSVAPVSVVVPTVGRLEPLRSCLESLTACEPRADEILVVDQSGDPAIDQLVGGFAASGARLVPCSGRGVSRGRNVGVTRCRHELVLVTDDDCTVSSDWVATAARLTQDAPNAIVTGRVVPVGEPLAVPSSKDEDAPHDYTGTVHAGGLFPNNMAFHRSAVLAAGGFDERFGPGEAAEDNEFCYRWLTSGHELRYEPSLVVWHHDWRSPSELERLYVAYARGQGFFYAKYLRQGDPTMLRYLLRDLYWALRGLAASVVKRRPAWTDPRRGIMRGLPGGLLAGWRVYGREAPAADTPARPGAGA